MGIAIRTVDVEVGLPPLDEARRLVMEEGKTTKGKGVKLLKRIHGPG